MSFAAAFQGPAAVARGLFATLQSAGMGGYGAAVVNGFTSSGALINVVGSVGTAIAQRVRLSKTHVGEPQCSGEKDVAGLESEQLREGFVPGII